jgi:hypothetical protein
LSKKKLSKCLEWNQYFQYMPYMMKVKTDNGLVFRAPKCIDNDSCCAGQIEKNVLYAYNFVSVLNEFHPSCKNSSSRVDFQLLQMIFYFSFLQQMIFIYCKWMNNIELLQLKIGSGQLYSEIFKMILFYQKNYHWFQHQNEGILR